MEPMEQARVAGEFEFVLLSLLLLGWSLLVRWQGTTMMKAENREFRINGSWRPLQCLHSTRAAPQRTAIATRKAIIRSQRLRSSSDMKGRAGLTREGDA